MEAPNSLPLSSFAVHSNLPRDSRDFPRSSRKSQERSSWSVCFARLVLSRDVFKAKGKKYEKGVAIFYAVAYGSLRTRRAWRRLLCTAKIRESDEKMEFPSAELFFPPSPFPFSFRTESTENRLSERRRVPSHGNFANSARLTPLLRSVAPSGAENCHGKLGVV